MLFIDKSNGWLQPSGPGSVERDFDPGFLCHTGSSFSIRVFVTTGEGDSPKKQTDRSTHNTNLMAARHQQRLDQFTKLVWHVVSYVSEAGVLPIKGDLCNAVVHALTGGID
jgi:hypothetical protein